MRDKLTLADRLRGQKPCPVCNEPLENKSLQKCPSCGNQIKRLSKKGHHQINGIQYDGYTIVPRVKRKTENHPENGEWVASDYCIGILKGDLYTEKKYSHTPQYFREKNRQ